MGSPKPRKKNPKLLSHPWSAKSHLEPSTANATKETTRKKRSGSRVKDISPLWRVRDEVAREARRVVAEVKEQQEGQTNRVQGRIQSKRCSRLSTDFTRNNTKKLRLTYEEQGIPGQMHLKG